MDFNFFQVAKIKQHSLRLHGTVKDYMATNEFANQLSQKVLNTCIDTADVQGGMAQKL